MTNPPRAPAARPRSAARCCLACYLFLLAPPGGLLWLCLILLLSLRGYQLVGEALDARRYPPPGQLVDVGGYRLHLHCLGAGEPTVILDSGLSGFSLDWRLVQPEVSQFTRVCAYDRAGYGWSEAGPTPRSSQQMVTELHTLLQNAGLAPPYVLVGQSLGGLNMRLYASQYPHEVAGMVQVDASQEELMTSLPPEIRQIIENNERFQLAAFRVLPFLAQHGVMRLSWQILGPGPFTFLEDYPPETGAVLMAICFSKAQFYSTMVQELAAFPVIDMEQMRAAGPQPDVPYLVLVRGLSDSTFVEHPEWETLSEQTWYNLQAQLAARMPQGQLIVAENSHHVIHQEQPEIVIEAIRQVVEIKKP